jgi:hypothetical protein
MAIGSNAMLVIDGNGFASTIGDGYLAPGEGVRIRSPIRSPAAVGRLVVFCRDDDLVLRSWSNEGGRKVYRSRWLRRKHYPNNNVIFNDLFPGVDLTAVEEYPVVLEPLGERIPAAGE